MKFGELVETWVWISALGYGVKLTFRFRHDPVPGIRYSRSHMGQRCGGNGRGLPWKRAFVRDRSLQREIREEFGRTFTMPDKLPYKYGDNHDRSWKRSKKQKQWM